VKEKLIQPSAFEYEYDKHKRNLEEKASSTPANRIVAIEKNYKEKTPKTLPALFNFSKFWPRKGQSTGHRTTISTHPQYKHSIRASNNLTSQLVSF
jgi:hypothetical protein